MISTEKKLMVLLKIAKVLNKQNFVWAIGASCMLYLNNITNDFHDDNRDNGYSSRGDDQRRGGYSSHSDDRRPSCDYDNRGSSYRSNNDYSHENPNSYSESKKSRFSDSRRPSRNYKRDR